MTDSLRASVTATTPVVKSGPARVLIDGSDTPVTANGLTNYTPSPGDRLLVQQVGTQVEILQFLSVGTVPYLPSDGTYTGAVSVSQLISGVLQSNAKVTFGSPGDFTGASEVSVTKPGVDPVSGKPTGGIIVTDPTNPGGDPLVQLHPLGCTFRGKVITDILTVMQNLIVNGTASLSGGATLTLQNGVTTPTAPTLSQGPTTTPWDMGYATFGYVEKGIHYNAADGLLYHVLWAPGSKSLNVQSVNPTTGVATSVLNTTDGTSQMVDVSGLVKIGSNFYIMARVTFGGSSPDTWNLKRYSSAGVDSGFYPALVTASSAAGLPVIGYDAGIGKLVAGFKTPPSYPSPTYANHIFMYAFDPTTMVRDTTYNGVVDVAAPTLGSNDFTMRSIEVGSFDYGAASYSIGGDIAGAGVVLRVPYAAVGTASGIISVNEDTTKAWTTPSLSAGGLTWHGGLGAFVSTHNSGTLSKWSSYYPLSTDLWWAKTADTGAGLTTAGSPISTSLTVLPRRFVFASLRPAPSGVTGADLWVGYGTAVPANFYKRPETISGRGFTMAGKDTSGTTTVPSVGTFATLNSIIQSNAGGFVVRGDGSGDWPFLRTTIAATTVASVTYATGWSDLIPAETTQVEKADGKWVAFYLAANKGASTAGELICTIPVGYRPRRTSRVTGNNNGSIRSVTISPNGEVRNDVAQSVNAAMIGMGGWYTP